MAKASTDEAATGVALVAGVDRGPDGFGTRTGLAGPGNVRGDSPVDLPSLVGLSG
jgi:hypothetical protein